MAMGVATSMRMMMFVVVVVLVLVIVIVLVVVIVGVGMGMCLCLVAVRCRLVARLPAVAGRRGVQVGGAGSATARRAKGWTGKRVAANLTHNVCDTICT